MKFKDIKVFTIGALATALVYIILSEDHSVKSLLLGLALGIASMAACVLFFPDEFLDRYDIKFFPLIWYLIRLVAIIIASGVNSLILGYSKNTEAVLITYKSELNCDTLITLLANSITLTPGTATIDKNGNTLRVMKLCPGGCADDVSDIKRLEDMIKKVERSGS